MNDGITFDRSEPITAPTVLCGGIVHELWRGQIQGVEDLDNYTLWFLAMPAPDYQMIAVDLDKHPEYATNPPNTAQLLMSEGHS